MARKVRAGNNGAGVVVSVRSFSFIGRHNARSSTAGQPASRLHPLLVKTTCFIRKCSFYFREEELVQD